MNGQTSGSSGCLSRQRRLGNSATVDAMRNAAAWNVTGIDRSTQALAEEAARRARMRLGDWLDEVVSEQAAGQGVGAEDVADDDRLESVGGRLALAARLRNRPRA